MMFEDVAFARSEFYERADRRLFCPKYAEYVRTHRLDVDRITGFAGVSSVLPVLDCGKGRFDFVGHGEPVEAFVLEVLDFDGETHLDIAAWPLCDPGRVLTMFGRAPLIGMWAALNPATYYMGKALVMHRTPLEWLMSGCSGAAVLVPRLAARQLIDLPGPLAARDHRHGLQLRKLMLSVVETDRIVLAGERDASAA